MNWIQQLFRRRRIYSDLSEEIREHLDEKIDELVASGMTRDDASAAARREFGNPTLLEERGREAWQWRALETTLRDIRYALRQLRRNPGYPLTVLLTLTFAIGLNTAVFSVVNALLLRPLPYAQPDRLASLNTHRDGLTSAGKSVSDDEDSVDGETWELVRDNVPAVTAAVYSLTGGVNLQTATNVRYVQEQRVTTRYFDVLGIHLLAGRGFTADEDTPHGPKAVVLSYELWKSLFSSDPSAVGQTIRLKGELYTVVGILPAHAQTNGLPDLWTPLQPSRTGEGSGDNYGILMRLQDGATWAQVNSQLAPLHPRMLEDLLKNYAKGHANLFAMPLQEDLAKPQRGQVLVLMSAVAFILLIACANLAGLMLIRTGRRASEIATRLALGATRGAILRQVMTEPVLLAMAGGAIGLVVAAEGLTLLGKLLPPDMLPVGGLPMDWRVMGFALAASVITSLLIGILPVREVRRIALRPAMASRSGDQAGGRRTRQSLIVVEVMLTVVLLAGAGLLIRSLVYLQTLVPGFDATNVMTAKVSLDDVRYHDAAAFHKLLENSVAAMAQLPGVESAAVGLSLPYERGLNSGIRVTDGAQAGQGHGTSMIYVTPDYFRALRIPVLAGRTFLSSDTADVENVAVVNVTFAQSYFKTANAVGRHLRSGKTAYTVVGVVGDVIKRPGLRRTAPLGTEVTMYIPAAQVDQATASQAHVWFQPSWIVRTNGPIIGLPAAMQSALAKADPNMPFAGFHSMSDLQANALVEQRTNTSVLGVLAALALLLSLVGVYGLVANMVAQRTREIGIRMALGSTTSQAMMEVGKSGMIAVACGLAGGLVLSALTLRIIQSQLYGVHAYDPATLSIVLALLTLAATAASFLPTLRIARIDPALTLRAE
jgi:putative ABC transport system permease protein